MKKIFLTLALVVAMAFYASAQRHIDGFYNDWDNDYDNRLGETLDITMPSAHIGNIDNESAAPLGSGLLVLTALGAGYMVTKRKK